MNSLFQKYNPRLDGLRAVAVLCVIFSHYRFPGFIGGGYGVDIFFVLSGFLITLVLIKSHEKKESIFVFYWRRFLRLMPALAFMCLCYFVFSLFFSKMMPLNIVLKDIFASIFYMSNWTRAFSVGTPMIPVFIAHTWSLAIEEQFYLIWPALFLFLSSGKKGKNVLAIVTALLFMSIAWTIYGELNNFGLSHLYNGFDTRCFVLIMGCCLALYFQNPNGEKIFNRLSKIWPLAVIGLIYVVVSEGVGPNTIYRSLLVGILTVLIIISAYLNPESLLGKFLGLKPMVAIGKISYGLYLWHFPIWLILLSGFRLSWGAVTFVGIPLSFFAAFISYHFIEKKLLRFRDSPNLPLRDFGVITVSISVIGMFISGMYFLYGPIKAILFPTPIIIQAYSPYQMRVGETINVQSDGQSYFVMTTSQKLQGGTKLRIENKESDAYILDNLIAVPLSRDQLSKAGKKEVVLISSVGASLAPPVFFEVFEKK